MGKLFWMFIFSTKRWRFHRLIKANTYSNIHCLHFVCKYTFIYIFKSIYSIYPNFNCLQNISFMRPDSYNCNLLSLLVTFLAVDYKIYLHQLSTPVDILDN